jgi:hypothetical protein
MVFCWFAIIFVKMGEISFSITSAGYNLGTDFSISYNNTKIAFSGYCRGLNVAIFDQTTGSLLNTSNFDTCEDSNASDAFSNLIEPLSIGRIVVVAGSCNVSPY